MMAIAESDVAAEPAAEVLIFRVGSERFAIDVAAIDEVIELPPIRPVPAMPPAMLGVCELRGALLPVYSPAAALNVPLGEAAAAIVARVPRRHGGVGGETRRVGIAVAAAEGVTVWESDGAHGLSNDGVVLGVTARDGALVALIDAAAFVAACTAGGGGAAGVELPVEDGETNAPG
jgi:purine-binding chemotaxis protein CheW